MAHRALQLLLTVCLAASTSLAADNPFLGKWKLNPEKSTLHDEMKVAAAGENRYGFDFGSGTPEMIVVDGTDQAGLDGTTLAVTAESPNNWKVVRKKDGRMLVTGIWTLSADGTTLHDDFTASQPNGSPFHLDYIYTRTAGASGFAGTWDSTTEKVNSGVEIQVQPYEGDGLSFINAAQQSTKSVKFDGKDYPVQGPNVRAGSTSSANRVDSRTLELTEKLNGKVTDTQHIQLSPDGKTLTMTIQPASGRKPNVLIFERE